MSNIAIITARGGSKRIPRKNIKEFCGRPIMEYSIKAAIDSGIYDVVMVSTEDEEIAEIGRAAGAEIPFYRSEKTAGDFATTADVLEEVLLEYKKLGKEFDFASVIYPTAPFVTGSKLKSAMEILEAGKADSVLPVVRFDFPPQRAFVMKDGLIEFQYPEYMKARSQDLEPIYHDCGQFCSFDVKKFLEKKTVLLERTSAIVVPESEVQDIDNPEDWKIAEMKYTLMREKQ